MDAQAQREFYESLGKNENFNGEEWMRVHGIDEAELNRLTERLTAQAALIAMGTGSISLAIETAVMTAFTYGHDFALAKMGERVSG